MSTVYGKALLVITREHEEGESPRYCVTPFIQSATGGKYAHECAYQDFDLLTYETLPVPNAARKLRPWETVRVYVVYRFCYTKDYYGEGDVDLDYRKERVLRWQRPRPYYESKK